MSTSNQAAALSFNRVAPRHRWGDWLFFNLTRFFAFLTLVLLAGIIVSLIHGSLPAIQKFGLSFLWTAEWNPPAERFGALIPIYGTLMTSARGPCDCRARELRHCPVSD